jgi:methyl-accepting chemotaxis protein
MNLTIKARLLFAFTLLVAISGIIYFIGSKNTENLNARVNQIINVNTNRMMLSVKLSEDVQFLTAREKELVMTREPIELQELTSEFDKRHTEFEDRLEQLKVIVDERGLEFVNDFAANWQEYLKDHRKIRNLAVNVNTDSASQIAAKLSRTTARESSKRAITALTKIVKKNEAELGTVQAQTDELYEAGKNNMLISLLVAVAVAIAIAYWIINSISTSIAKAKTALQAVANGDLTVEIDIENKDEIGELLRHLESMIEKVKGVIASVTSAADNIASASQQMSGSSQQMSEGATEQAASAEEVSSSMEEMAANIQQNTDNAQQTERIAMKAAEDVQEGSRVVNQTVDSMKKIAEKITIIGEIARQTNLLALNAAVEAARAGEHGKGFAVVAAEVRKLAERSQLAANEINDLSSSSVAVAEKSGKLLEQIVPNIQNTSRLVQEISASSMEQNAGAEQVNNAIQQLNQVIQQNAAAAEEMASSSEELSSQADQLKDTVEFFNVGNSYKKTKSAGPAKFKQKQLINVAHSGANKLNIKKNATGQTGLNLDLSSKDSLDSEFERY